MARGMIVRAIRAGQIRDPQSPACGVFHRTIGAGAEAESIDHNWAAFGGCALARLLQGDPQRLSDWPEDDRQLVLDALRLAAEAMLRRWPRAGYTNILLMAMYLTLAAGRFLGDDELRSRAERKFSQALRFIRTTGAFEEYISPTYTGVNLSALVPLAELERSGPLGAECLWLLQLQWRLLARQVHLPAGQIAGPHSRAYYDKAGEGPGPTHDYIFLATDGAYPLRPDKFTLSGHPGLFWPLRVPDDALAEMLDDYAAGPRQHRQLVEWIGRDEGLPAPGPDEPPRRFRLTTTYKTDNFCLGTVNEQDVWHQRRNLLAYWPDGAGGTTGIKAEVQFSARWFESRFLGEWPFQMAVTFSSVQHGPAVLGAYHMAQILPARPGDRLHGLSRYAALGHENDTEPRNPAAWLLGTHWRQPIEPEQRISHLERVAIRLSPIGPGRWVRHDTEGLLWTFSHNDVHCTVTLRNPAKLEDGSLVLLDLKDLRWDWLAPPDIFAPFGLYIRHGGQIDVGMVQPVRLERDRSGAFTLDWRCFGDTHLCLQHTPTPAPHLVERPT